MEIKRTYLNASQIREAKKTKQKGVKLETVQGEGMTFLKVAPQESVICEIATCIAFVILIGLIFFFGCLMSI